MLGGGGGGVSHPSQLTTGLVIKSVTTSPTLAGERMLFILQVSILSEQLLCLQNIANPMAMSVFVRQEKITVRMGLQSDPTDPTKTRLLSRHFTPFYFPHPKPPVPTCWVAGRVLLTFLLIITPKVWLEGFCSRFY